MHTAYWRVFFKSFASYLDHHFAELLRGGTRHEFAFEERWPHIVSDFALLTTNSDGLARNLVSQQVLGDFLGPFTIFVELWVPFGTFWVFLGPFESYWDHLSHFWDHLRYLWIFGTFWYLSWTFLTFGSSGDILGLFGTIWWKFFRLL